MVAPLIVTALLPSDTQQYFDALRRKHFPAERNHLAAHLTVFHALPGEREADVRDTLRSLAAQEPLDATVRAVRSLGNGVAFRVESAPLMEVREQIASRFEGDLTPQDRQKRELHITVQNKVEPATARTLLDELQKDFEPSATAITGLGLWRYLGGPWEPIETFPFRILENES